MDRNELIESNLRLVHACAKRFAGKGIEYDDLYMAGCVGLIKAVDRFDEGRGYALSTYAVPVILGEIRGLFRSGGSVKLSRSLQELSMKAKAVCEEYRAQNGEDIRLSALAERLGVDPYKAAQALNASRAVLSLSADEEDEPIEIPVPSPEDSLTDRLSLREAIDSLGAEERSIIDLRYFRHMTQSRTARELGSTQVQISRREKKILMKLRGMLV